VLKNFKVDPQRSQLVVPVEFYQMDLIRAVENARKLDPELFVDGDDTLPSWSKFAKDPVKAMGLWTHILQAVFLGQNNMPEMTVARQVGKAETQQVVMMFLPGSIRRSAKVDHLVDVVDITRNVLRGWRIIPVYGVETSNRKAEQHVKEEIEKAKKAGENVLILSAGMAQRSFSIGDITTLYLCYDEGDAGATTQKISRALTPSKVGKVGRIFSLSFDPNRDDKFDSMMIAAANNYAARKGIEVDAALRIVIETVDIFSCSKDGRIKIDHDRYLMQLLERNSISRVTGRQADMNELTLAEIELLAEGNSDYSRAEKTAAAPKGKTGAVAKKATPKRSEMGKEELKMLDKARKTLVTIVEHLPYLAFMTNTTSIRNSLIRCGEVADYDAYVTEEFGVPAHKILEFFDRGVLPLGLASLQKAAKTLQIQAA
jgi:hypothetical protein